ncbi:hypothetical protein K438DRAFT_1829508 [Mycena galopus ATCC 62051]|nr:hypothetical protein K438DRAFT_1829508 [Mycena galopus ATCC 62051]
MPFLPQELVNAIIAELEVGDLETLRAYSLVGPRFRVPSQQILLHSITLSGWLKDVSQPENYGAARILLEESPHVATYVTGLKLRLRTPLLDADSLQWVLQQLVNVRRCAVDGHRQLLYWDRLPSSLAEALLDFTSRQKLHDLRVARLAGLPGEVFLRAAPTLSFFRVLTLMGIPDPPTDIVSPTVLDLVLHSGSGAIYTLLAYPSFNPYISKLRRLSFKPINHHRSQPLVVPAADTLEHIHLVCNAARIDRPNHPPTSPRPAHPRVQGDLRPVANPTFYAGHHFRRAQLKRQPHSRGGCHVLSVLAASPPPDGFAGAS